MKSWSSQDIHNLKRCFLENKSLKEIAYTLGRSTTSVNKALTRFKIRTYKEKKYRSLRRQSQDEFIRNMDPDMFEVFEFVRSCMSRCLKRKKDNWIYRGSEIEEKRAFVLINNERSSRKFPLFYFKY